MRILQLALKDLDQIFRDRRSLIFLILMPIGFTLFMGFAYRSSGPTEETRLLLGWVNADPQGTVSAELLTALENHPALRLTEIAPMDMENAIHKVRKGELAGILSIPPGFSDAVLAGANPQIELFADELTNSGQSAFQMVRASVTRVMGAVKIAALTASALSAQNLVAPGKAMSTETESAFSAAAQTWSRFAKQGTQVVVEKGKQRTDNQPFGGNPYNQTSPGILTQFALFGLVSSANILVQERKTHTLQRMLTTSMSSAGIIAGHLLANFLLCLGQTIMLIVFGQLVLGVDYIRQPAAVLLVSIALSLWIAALGLAISVFAAVGRFTPTAWAMTGYQNILMRGLDFSSAWLPAGIMLAYAAAFFFIAVWRFSRRALA